MSSRRYTPADQVLIAFDQALRTVFGAPNTTGRANPAKSAAHADLDPAEQKLSERLMRVNHAGEVAAQALYQGQALTARLEEVRAGMERAAAEENDHLRWCEERIRSLEGHTSYLNPFWYAGSFAIGAAAGLAGDKWSLGFVAETERQVVRHLDEHLHRLPPQDQQSRAILEQMKDDEMHHATVAMEAGAAELPEPIRRVMTTVSKVMTRTAFWV